MKPLYLDHALGIDIRENCVGLTLLGKKLRSVEIVGTHFFRTRPLVPGDDKNEQAFLEKMNQALTQWNLWPQNVAVSLPRIHFTFQNFELPAPDMKSLLPMIPFELERHFSSQLEDLYFGYHAAAKAGKQFHVIAAAVRKEIAEHHLNLLRRLNLKPTVLEAPPFANASLALSQPGSQDGLSAVIDLTPGGIDLAILKDKTLAFSRFVPLDLPAYERAFFQGKLDKQETLALSGKLTGILVEELAETLSLCRNVEDDASIGRIHLINAGTLAPFLERQLQKATETATARASADDIERAEKDKAFPKAYLSTALSLGLRGIQRREIEANLLPENQKPAKKSVPIKATLGIAAAAVVVLAGLSINKIVYNNLTLKKLNQQLQEIKIQTKELEKIDLEFEALKRFADRIAALNAANPAKLPVLVELSRNIPQDTWLTHLKIAKNEVEIKGYSSTASKLVPLLERSTVFRETGFVGSIVNQKEGEKFTLRTDLKVKP